MDSSVFMRAVVAAAQITEETLQQYPRTIESCRTLQIFYISIHSSILAP